MSLPLNNKQSQIDTILSATRLLQITPPDFNFPTTTLYGIDKVTGRLGHTAIYVKSCI